MRCFGIIKSVNIWIICKKMNQYFPNVQCIILQKHAQIKALIQSAEQLVDFKVTS